MEKRIIQKVNDHLREVKGQVTDLVKKVTAGSST